MPGTLVLLPGMNCSARLWSGVIEAAGDGPVGVPWHIRHEPLDRPGLDEQVQCLLDRLPNQFALGGLSLGAIVAMAVHRQAPQRVTGMFLVATNPRPPTDEQRQGWHHHLQRLASGTTPVAMQRELLSLLLGDDQSEPLNRIALEMAAEIGLHRLQAQLRLQLTRVDERPGLRGLEVPCTVVAAAQDRLCPMERQREIHQLVTDSELVVLDDAPHLATLSKPRQVAEAMAAWWHRVDR